MNQEQIDEMKQTLEAQNEELERISQSPLVYATFLQKDKDFSYVTDGGSVLRVMTPDFAIKPGSPVLLYKDTYQIVEAGKNLSIGAVTTIKEILQENQTSLVEINGHSTSVLNQFDSKKGDRVILDKSSMVVIANLGSDNKEYAPPAVPNVTWDDIGGQEHAKAEMIEAIDMPHKYKKEFAYYNKKPSKGVLLYGPPGCGKTMFGKAAANSLSKIYGQPAGFVYIKGPELMDKFFGESESKVRGLFASAREHYAQYGAPSVIFIDEADSLLATRGERFSGLDTIVTQFLTEMDGIEDSAAIVILATNRPEILDPAVIREGRIDRKVRVGRPSREATQEIFSLNLRNVPASEDKNEMAKNAADFLFQSEVVSNVSGAMIAGIVDRAISIALKRDIHSGKQSGLSMDDIGNAIEALELQEGTDELERKAA